MSFWPPQTYTRTTVQQGVHKWLVFLYGLVQKLIRASWEMCPIMCPTGYVNLSGHIDSLKQTTWNLEWGNTINFQIMSITSSPPSAAYMHQWTGSALVQVMACRLFGAKPLPEPMLVDCQLESWKQVSVKFGSEFYHFYSRKCIWKCHLPK